MIFKFDSSQDALNACRFGLANGTRLRAGSVLVIESEKIVAVADFWPICVTEEKGKLFQVSLNHVFVRDVAPDLANETVSPALVGAERDAARRAIVEALSLAWTKATDIATENGWPLKKPVTE